MGDGQGKESKDTLPSKWMIIFLGLNSFTLGVSQKARNKSHDFFLGGCNDDGPLAQDRMRHSVVRTKDSHVGGKLTEVPKEKTIMF